MQRMGSPTGQAEKPFKMGATTNFGHTMNTTMAGTMKQGQSTMSMNSTGQVSNAGKLTYYATHHSSPFKESIQRGMMTGVGLLGQK